MSSKGQPCLAARYNVHTTAPHLKHCTVQPKLSFPFLFFLLSLRIRHSIIATAVTAVTAAVAVVDTVAVVVGTGQVSVLRVKNKCDRPSRSELFKYFTTQWNRTAYPSFINSTAIIAPNIPSGQSAQNKTHIALILPWIFSGLYICFNRWISFVYCSFASSGFIALWKSGLFPFNTACSVNWLTT